MGRILGIDHGNRRIGLALSDPMQIISKPLETITYSNIKTVFEKLKLLVREKEVEKIILWLPLGMRGHDTDQTRQVREFGVLLESELMIKVDFEDERLSSLSARKILILQGVKTGHEKGQVDKTAAAIILQQHLDRVRN
ncbi:MAG: Holliday junction resolvase RuvX [Candidatus Neomarinimicrobiota bacterium]